MMATTEYVTTKVWLPDYKGFFKNVHVNIDQSSQHHYNQTFAYVTNFTF